MRSELPFLVRHGELMWICLVIGTALLAVALLVRSTLRARHNKADPKLFVRARLAWSVLVGVSAGLAMFLALRVVGIIALKQAGDHPFADREDNHIAELHPIAIAAATPGNGEEALDTLTRAGFELRDTCTTRLAHGHLDELLAHIDECAAPATWMAYAYFVQGLPCEAADALGASLWSRPTAGTLSLAYVSQLGCRRWADAAVSAHRLEKASPDSAELWRCLAAGALAHANDRYRVPVDICLAVRLDRAPAEERAVLARSWAAAHLDIFDITVSGDGTDLTTRNVTTFAAMTAAPEVYSFARTLERLDPVDPGERPDFVSSMFGGNGFLGPSMMSAFAARIVDRGGEGLRSGPRAEFLRIAAIGDIIAGDFDRARGRIRAARAVVAEMTEDDDGPRRGTIDSARRKTDWLDELIRYRLGEPLVGPTHELSRIDTAILAVRRGETPVVNEDQFVTEEVVSFVRSTVSGDLSRLRRELTNGGPDFRIGGFLTALAPRLRPAPPELLEWLDTPHWSLGSLSPATVAWDAASRRDMFRLLGEPRRAERWAVIARRQWEIATAPDLAIYFGLLHDVAR